MGQFKELLGDLQNPNQEIEGLNLDSIEILAKQIDELKFEKNQRYNNLEKSIESVKINDLESFEIVNKSSFNIIESERIKEIKNYYPQLIPLENSKFANTFKDFNYEKNKPKINDTKAEDNILILKDIIDSLELCEIDQKIWYRILISLIEDYSLRSKLTNLIFKKFKNNKNPTDLYLFVIYYLTKDISFEKIRVTLIALFDFLLKGNVIIPHSTNYHDKRLLFTNEILLEAIEFSQLIPGKSHLLNCKKKIMDFIKSQFYLVKLPSPMAYILRKVASAKDYNALVDIVIEVVPKQFKFEREF